MGIIFWSCQKEKVILTSGMVITNSVKIEKQDYQLNTSDLSNAAITIKGDDITVECF